MSLRDQNRGLDPRTMRIYASMGLTACCSTIRPRTSLREMLRNTGLHRAFVLTEDPTKRLTDAAFALLVSHYVTNRFKRENIRDTAKKSAATIAVLAYNWMHPDANQPVCPPAVYDAINTTLGLYAPDHRSYTRTIALWINRVVNLQPATVEVNPLRAQYHVEQLHYILPDYVPDDAAAQINSFCDLTLAHDMVVPPNFTIDSMDAAAWETAWRALTLVQKLRYYELQTVLEFRSLTNRSGTMFITALVALAKGGNVTDKWIQSRTAQLENLGHLEIVNDVLTPEIVNTLYVEFVATTDMSPEVIYNWMVTLYHRAQSVNLAPLSWIIEQATMPNASAITMVTTAILRGHIRAEYLLHIGVPRNEITSIAKLAILLLECHLANVVRPVVSASEYRTLVRIARSLTADLTFQDLATLATASTHIARAADTVCMTLVKTISRDINAAYASPVVIMRSRYGVQLRENNDGTCQQWTLPGPIVADPQGLGWSQPMSAGEMMLKVPETAFDRALTTLLEAVLQIGQQRPLEGFDPEHPVGPYHRVDQRYLDAARELGYVHPRVDPPVYRRPRRPHQQVVRPPWDLGCIGGQPIPDPGHQGNQPGDDRPDEDHDGRMIGGIRVNAGNIVRLLTGEIAFADIPDPDHDDGQGLQPRPPLGDVESSDDDDDVPPPDPRGGGAVRQFVVPNFAINEGASSSGVSRPPVLESINEIAPPAEMASPTVAVVVQPVPESPGAAEPLPVAASGPDPPVAPAGTPRRSARGRTPISPRVPSGRARRPRGSPGTGPASKRRI